MILALIIIAVVWSALVVCAVLYVGGTQKPTPRPNERPFDEGWWD